MAGAKLGWIIGGIASLLWLPIMTIVWLVQGYLLFPGISLALFVLGLGYLFFFAPWKYPTTPIWILYLGFLGILLIGGIVAILQLRELLSLGQLGFFLFLWVFAFPIFSFGSKSWSDLQSENA